MDFNMYNIGEFLKHNKLLDKNSVYFYGKTTVGKWLKNISNFSINDASGIIIDASCSTNCIISLNNNKIIIIPCNSLNDKPLIEDKVEI